jgi:hypothetical protein
VKPDLLAVLLAFQAGDCGVGQRLARPVAWLWGCFVRRQMDGRHYGCNLPRIVAWRPVALAWSGRALVLAVRVVFLKIHL